VIAEDPEEPATSAAATARTEQQHLLLLDRLVGGDGIAERRGIVHFPPVAGSSALGTFGISCADPSPASIRLDEVDGRRLAGGELAHRRHEGDAPRPASMFSSSRLGLAPGVAHAQDQALEVRAAVFADLLDLELADRDRLEHD
jgi:hypothetical protein